MLPRGLLEELRCPYCGGGLALAAEMRADAGGIADGIVRCPCGESPVLEGTLWLSKRVDGHVMGDPPAVGAALARLREGDAEGAMVEALLDSARHPLRRAATGLARMGGGAGARAAALLGPVRRWVRERVVKDRSLTFARAVYLLRNRAYADYLYQRFANPSLLSAIPLMTLLRQVEGAIGTGEVKTPRPWRRERARVVDIGGGAGHAAFLMGRLAPGLEVILTDGEFSNLFMAGRYVAPAAVRICLDAEAPLPFADEWAHAMFSMDAFHYMRSKVAVAREMRRVAAEGALWVFPHLHNALGSNPAAGYPLSAADYRRVFAPLGARLWPQDEVLERFHREQALDLSRPAEEGAVERADALAMVAGSASVWRRHELGEEYLRAAGALRVNPLLRAQGDGVWRAEWPGDALREECRGATGVLPPEAALEQGFLERAAAGRLDGPDRERALELARRFVLVPLPERYG